MRRRNETEHAEVGTSAMIIFIALILVSSIISAIIIGVGGDVFSQSKTDASRNTPSMKGIANIVVLEIESLGANDGIHIVFELPYVEAEVPEIFIARTHPLKDTIDEIREIFVTLGFCV